VPRCSSGGVVRASVRLGMVLLLPVLGLAGCGPSEPPIKLNPPQALSAPRRVVRAAPAQPARSARRPLADPARQACASPALQGLTAPRKAELFRQFAESQGQQAADIPAPAGPPPCPPGSS